MDLTTWLSLVAVCVIVALLLAGGPVLSWLRRHIAWVDRAMGSILILLGLNVVISTFL